MNVSQPTIVDRFEKAAHSKAVYPVLLFIEVLETTFVPIPYEAILIALVLAAPERVWHFVFISVLGSMIGGAILYAVGAGLAQPVATFFGIESKIAGYLAVFDERGGVLVFLAAITPVPGYIINIVAGASGYPMASFLTLVALGRFLRFALIGWLVAQYGEAIVDRWNRLPRRVRWVGLAVLLVGVTWWSLAGLT